MSNVRSLDVYRRGKQAQAVDYSEIEKYRSAIVGMQYLQAKNLEGAKKSLEKLASDIGVDKKYIPLLKGSLVRKEGVARALQLYAVDYDQARGQLDASEIPGFYASQLEKYVSEEDLGRASEVFGEFAGESFDSIAKKYRKAEHILKQPDLYDEKEREGAQKTIEKYGKYMTLVTLFEQAAVRKIMAPIDDDLIRENVRQILRLGEQAEEAIANGYEGVAANGHEASEDDYAMDMAA